MVLEPVSTRRHDDTFELTTRDRADTSAIEATYERVKVIPKQFLLIKGDGWGDKSKGFPKCHMSRGERSRTAILSVHTKTARRLIRTTSRIRSTFESRKI